MRNPKQNTAQKTSLLEGSCIFINYNLAIVLPKEIEFRAFNATVTIPGNPIPINNPSSSSTITLTLFNLQDYLLNT
jgi:hypothetical protein